jgi:SAM-dependent methyltransferase
VFCCLSFHHYPDDVAAADTFRRVLRKGGIACVADPGPAWFIAISKKLSQLTDPGFVRHRTGEEFQALFTKAGFQSVCWTEVLPGIGVTLAVA